MPSFCAVSNCELKYSHSENVSFHKFPLKNPKILSEWVKFTNRPNWTPSRWNSICSRHFDKSDFREYLSRKCLKKDAIPSIVTKNNITYETYHITAGSTEHNTPNISSEQDDFLHPMADDSKTSSEMIDICRLCGDRADNLTCNSLRSYDDPEVEILCRKCFPSLSIHSTPEQSRIVCSDCIAQMRHFADFIDKVLSYQRELGFNEHFDSYAASESSLVKGNESGGKPTTPNPNTTIFIKQEPINVKQEKVDSSNRRPFTTQVPTTSPSLCLNPFAESKKLKGFVQQEINLPKTEVGSTYCRAFDRIFGNNFEFRTHNCSNTDPNTDREQGNNCEIMEVITLNNPVSFIDLAEDENGTGIEQRKPKTEIFGEMERRERLEFEHAYAKRAANTNCNLKQEIIDSYNDTSQDGYDYNEQHIDNDEHIQNSYYEEAGQAYVDCQKCNQSFISQDLLDEHMATMHPLKLKICPICNAEFKSSKDYLLHKTKMHSQRFQCKCKQKFNTQSILRFHERRCSRHSKESSFSCRHCGKCLRNLTILRKHLGICTGKQSKPAKDLQDDPQSPKNTQHSAVAQRYPCDVCSQSFSKLEEFNQHRAMHLNVNPTLEKSLVENDLVDTRVLYLNDVGNMESSVKQSFKVVVDDSKFIFLNESKNAANNELKDALNAAFNGKCYACETCGHPFSSFLELKQHKLEHDSERKFSCSLCPKTFKGISGLKQHISGYHYKIKPYSCPVCNYSFALKGDMQRCRHSKLKNQNSLKIA